MAPEKKSQSIRKNKKVNQDRTSRSSINNAKPTTDNTSGANTTQVRTAHYQTNTVEHQQNTVEHSQQYVPFERTWEQAVHDYNHTAATANDAMLPMKRWQSEDIREQAWHGMDGAYLCESHVDVTDELVVELEGDGDVGSMVCAASSGTSGAECCVFNCLCFGFLCAKFWRKGFGERE